MCDYSLAIFPNRLATEGETLVTYRFSTGSIGFASPAEMRECRRTSPSAPAGFWAKLQGWFIPAATSCTIPAVCIPPGARLQIDRIPERAQRLLAVDPGEEVTFTEVTAGWNQFRDALRLKNRKEVVLQSVGEGLQVHVVSLTLPEYEEPLLEQYTYKIVPRA